MKQEHIELIRKACDGDLSAYEDFIRIYSPRVHAIAYQMLGNSIDAQDVAQEVFVRLYRKLDSYNPKSLFSTWLYRLTMNLSIDFFRKHSRHRRLSLDALREDIHLQDENPLPPQNFERSELKGEVRRVTQDLTLKQRKVFVLRELQGFTTEEIAEILGCRPSTVRVHLCKARASVKTALARRYPQERGK